MSPTRLMPWILGLALAAGSLSACDNEETDETDTSDTDTDPTGDVEPVYGVVSIPSGGDTTTSYVTLSDSLDGFIDPADAVIEVGGRAIAASPEGSGQLFVGTSTSGELVRYDLVDGSLTESGRANFAAQQVTAFAGYSTQLQFVDDDTAYWFGRDGRIVLWNPSEMIVTDAIVLDGMIREDPENPDTNYTTSITGAPVRDGDTLYSFVSWDSRAGTTIKVPGAYGIIVVDTTNDTAEFIVDEAGCGYGRDAVLDGEWLYIATEAVGTSVHYLNADNGPSPCLRRFNINTKQFDADYTVDLNALAGAPVGSLAVAADGTPLLHVLDTDQAGPLVEDGTISNPRALSSTALWKTARLTVGDSPALDILDVPLRSASVLPADLLDGLRVTPTFGAEPQVLEITAEGIVGTDRANAEVVGTTWAVFQIQ